MSLWVLGLGVGATLLLVLVASVIWTALRLDAVVDELRQIRELIASEIRLGPRGQRPKG